MKSSEISCCQGRELDSGRVSDLDCSGCKGDRSRVLCIEPWLWHRAVRVSRSVVASSLLTLAALDFGWQVPVGAREC